MKLSILGLLIGSTLCGCAMFEDEYAHDLSDDNLQAPYSSIPISLSKKSPPLESSLMFQKQFQSKITNTSSANRTSEIGSSNSHNEHRDYNKPISGEKLNINHYARGLMQNLVANLQSVNSTTPVAVVSFVMLDSDYNQSSLLGNQMAESLIHEIHKFGIPVIDYKTTGFIRITEQGDFAFSKDYEELGESLAARYIVGGTMVKHKDGYLVNARVVGLESKAVVASAQTLIPNSIADALINQPDKSNVISDLTRNTNNDNTLIMQQDAKHTISLVGN